MAKSEIPAQSVSYMPGIDVLRFISAAGVIFHHSAQQLYEKKLVPNPMVAQTLSGAFFLDVFFIISGFLICSILMKELALGKYSVRNFFARRIIRIWPLYFFVVLVFILIVPVVRKGFSGDVGHNLLFASSFSINFQLMMDSAAKTYTVLWSVCIEEHLYLLLPFLFLLFGRRFKLLSVILIISGFAFWLYFSAQHEKGGASPYYNTLCYFYYFGFGILLAAFYEVARRKITFLFSAGAQLAVLIVGFFYIYNKFPPACYAMPVWLLVSAVLGAYLVFAASLPSFILTPGPAVARFLGNVSYAMYLVHIFIINLLLGLFFKKVGTLSPLMAHILLPLLATAASTALATLLYYTFERPILRLKKKYTSVANK